MKPKKAVKELLAQRKVLWRQIEELQGTIAQLTTRNTYLEEQLTQLAAQMQTDAMKLRASQARNGALETATLTAYKALARVVTSPLES